MSGEKKKKHDNLQELRSEDFKSGARHGAAAQAAHPTVLRVRGHFLGLVAGDGGAQGLMGCRADKAQHHPNQTGLLRPLSVSLATCLLSCVICICS